MSSSCLITRLALENYKSIARCDVSLGALTFLVGANGSGKSNFLDALRFVADSLRNALDHAIRERGGEQSTLSLADFRAKLATMEPWQAGAEPSLTS